MRDGCFCLFKAFNNIFATLLAHLFEGELKLSRVQQEAKQELGVVLGVVEHLVLNLTQPLVVWVVSLVKNKKEADRQKGFTHDTQSDHIKNINTGTKSILFEVFQMCTMAL